MKKLISISDNVAHQLEEHAKLNKSSQSKVIEVALALYLALYSSARTMNETFKDLIPKGQTSIFDNIEK